MLTGYVFTGPLIARAIGFSHVLSLLVWDASEVFLTRKFQAEPSLVLSVLKEEFIFETSMLQLREE